MAVAATTKAPPAEKRSPLKKLGESATQLLEAEETTGVDQKTLLTTGIATAIGVVVGVVGSLFREEMSDKRVMSGVWRVDAEEEPARRGPRSDRLFSVCDAHCAGCVRAQHNHVDCVRAM